MCPHEEKLTAWLLGDLSPEERQIMTRHLDECAACRNVRDELSAVLTPLRSGLAKDRYLKENLQPAQPTKVTPPFHLWFKRQEWLRHAALFVAAFGTLFALISTVYHQASDDRHGDSPATNITFNRKEPPAPSLSPVREAKDAAKADLSDFRPDAIHSPQPAPIVTPPALPKTEPNMPSMRKLVAAPKNASEKEVAPAAAPASPALSASEKQAAKAVAKRERGKAEPSAITRPPANLQIKSVTLATRAASVIDSAPTNAVITNAVPATAHPHSEAPRNPSNRKDT